MGLDMYLTAKKYYSPYQNDDEFKEIRKISQVGSMMTSLNPYIYLEVNVAYWRKVNALHKWFVDTCQDGQDDCRTSYVSREQLQNLKKTCEEVLADNSKAEELLPTEEGCFFGSYEYGEYYFADLKQTIETLDQVLTLPTEWDFSYQSSW